jgi:hypothetical protein
MDGEFLLPVVHEGRELELSTKFLPTGFVYRFEVAVEQQVYVFEKDDEGDYRVIGAHTDDKSNNSLFEAIIQSLKIIAG